MALCPKLSPALQYVKCKGNKILDLLHANVREAYSSSTVPPLARSDHNLIHLVPVEPVVKPVKPVVSKQPATTRTVTVRSREAGEVGLLPDWDLVLEDHVEDTYCIKFCKDSVVPTKKVRCFPNKNLGSTRTIKPTSTTKRGSNQFKSSS